MNPDVMSGFFVLDIKLKKLQWIINHETYSMAILKAHIHGCDNKRILSKKT